jgi:hypothetical protein
MKHALRLLVAGAMELFLMAPAMAGQPIAAVHPGASATRARDIQGFSLGMPIREAVKRMTVTFSQGDQVQGKLGDIDVTLEYCPSGAVSFIETSQPLGHFIVDKAFLDTLDTKLFAKYGRGEGTADNLEWDLVEPVRYTTGEVRPFNTNWMSALVSEDSGDGVTLDLKMLDFRICWADYEKANRKPRSAAGEAIKL